VRSPAVVVRVDQHILNEHWLYWACGLMRGCETLCDVALWCLNICKFVFFFFLFLLSSNVSD
jgi:hypothetical protein